MQKWTRLTKTSTLESDGTWSVWLSKINGMNICGTIYHDMFKIAKMWDQKRQTCNMVRWLKCGTRKDKHAIW